VGKGKHVRGGITKKGRNCGWGSLLRGKSNTRFSAFKWGRGVEGVLAKKGE